MCANDLLSKEYIIFLAVKHSSPGKRNRDEPIDSLVCAVIPTSESRHNWKKYAENVHRLVRVRSSAHGQNTHKISNVDNETEAYNEMVKFCKEQHMIGLQSSCALVTYHKEDARPLKQINWMQRNLSDLYDEDDLETLLSDIPVRPRRQLTYLIDSTLHAVEDALNEASPEAMISDLLDNDDSLRLLHLELQEDREAVKEEREELFEKRDRLTQEEESFIEERKQWYEVGTSVAQEESALFDLRRDREKLLGQIASLKLERDALFEDLEKGKRTLKRQASSIRESTKEYEKVKDEIEDERQSLEEARRDTAKKKEKLTKLASNCAKEEKKLMKLRRENAATEKQLREAKEDLGKDKERLHHLQLVIDRQRRLLRKERIDLLAKRSSYHEDNYRSRESLHAGDSGAPRSEYDLVQQDGWQVPTADEQNRRARQLGHKEGYLNASASTHTLSTRSIYFSFHNLSMSTYKRGPGYCLVISYDHKRNGNSQDIFRIATFCREMNLEMDDCRNQLKRDVKTKIREVNAMFGQPTCRYAYLLVLIMAHGGVHNGAEFFCASVPGDEMKKSHPSQHNVQPETNSCISEGGRMDINKDLVRMFDTKRSAGLKGKPKLFLVQVCRGSQSNAETDGPTRPSSSGLFPSVIDTLIWKASVENCAAIRIPGEGSWFIKNALEEISKRREECLFNAIHAVTEKACQTRFNILDKNNEIKASFPVPCVAHSTMRDNFYF